MGKTKQKGVSYEVSHMLVPLCLCDKLSEKINVQEENYILAEDFLGFSL